ncbi:MAG: PspA-associated protein PspAB [Acidimicrobiales bacterium]
MGLLDTLLGRTKPVRANLDALFGLPSAAVTLQTAAGLVPSGAAGVCWKPPAGQSAEDVRREIGELLDIPDDGSTGAPGAAGGPGSSSQAGASVLPAAPTPLGQAEDSYGFQWLLVDDPDLEQLVTRVHLVNTTLTENGWGPQLLCSVFRFVPAPEAGADVRPLFLVYLYKRGTFYPFAPTGKESRDNELELRIRAVVGSDLPVEQDLARWFPLWELPVH